MGECPASGVLVYEEHERQLLPCTLTVEFWNRDYPYLGDEPRINFTAEDTHLATIATSGLNAEQVQNLRDELTTWLDRNPAASRENERRTDG